MCSNHKEEAVEKQCLWCGADYLHKEDDYLFCETCCENLEEIEAVTDMFNLTIQAELVLDETY